MKNYENVTIFNHPLINHKIAILRDEKTSMKEFRELVEEITTLMTFECLKEGVPTVEKQVKTPLEVCTQHVVKDNSIVIVPILRAGLGMVNGILSLVPTAKIGHIGLYRDEETLEPVEYYCKLPADVEERTVLLTDPMLATGGSADMAIDALKKRGVKKIIFLCILAAPDGVERLQKNHPDVDIFAAAYDEKLNEHGYIVPGLGDAGDRIFGTK